MTDTGQFVLPMEVSGVLGGLLAFPSLDLWNLPLRSILQPVVIPHL